MAFKNRALKKMICCLTAVCMVVTMIPAIAETAFARGTNDLPVITPDGREVIEDVIPDSRFMPTGYAFKYGYNGSEIKPDPVVRNAADKRLKEGRDYTVSTSGKIRNVGHYTITVKGIGDYAGEVTSHLVICPPETENLNIRLSTATGGFDDVYLTWDEVKGATGYKVYYKKSSESDYHYSGTTDSLSYLKKDLTDGTKYYFRVKPYYRYNGVNYLSTRYQYKTIYTLKKITTPKVTRYNSSRVKVEWTNIYGESGYQISKSSKSTGTYPVYSGDTTSGRYKTLSVTKKRTYYYKVRAYRYVTKSNGKKYTVYGPWSNTRKYVLK